MKIFKYLAAALLITVFCPTQAGIKKFAADSCAPLSHEEQVFARELLILNQEFLRLVHEINFNKNLTTQEITELQIQIHTIQKTILTKINAGSENNQKLVQYANYTIREFLTRQEMKVNNALIDELNRKLS